MTPTNQTAYADPLWWDAPTLDTDLHILESLGEPIPVPDHIDRNDWALEAEPALLRWFARENRQQYRQALRDNTYNSEQDLSAQFVFTVYVPEDAPDWCWAHDAYVVVEKHLGGDVRGNYGPFNVFKVDSLADTGFFNWVCSWFVRPVAEDYDSEILQTANDRLSVGYSSWPTGELRDLLHPGTEPAWSDTHKAYICRLDGVPFPVIAEPTAPFYCC